MFMFKIIKDKLKSIIKGAINFLSILKIRRFIIKTNKPLNTAIQTSLYLRLQAKQTFQP